MKKTYFVLGIFGLISLCAYILVRFIFLLLPGIGTVDKLMAILLILAELHLALHSLGFMIYVLRKSAGVVKKRRSAHIDFDNPPQVAVIVVARHEPKHVLEETFTAINSLDYKNKNLYLLDDSSMKFYKDEANRISKKYGARIFRRSKRHGAKAGIINDFLRKMKEPYLAIFDADQNPMPDFLKRVMPVIHGDSLLAFIQTPQVYTNLDTSPIAKASAMQQTIFYEAMSEGKEMGEAMFCCGTNVVFRKDALLKVGGFVENSVTEDFATSIKLHLEGFKSCYFNHAVAFGMAPESLPAYFKQQARWAAGDSQMLRFLLTTWFRHPIKTAKSMSFFKWWEYFLSSTFYFVGWSFLILMLTPAIYLIFNVPSFFMMPEIYFAIFIPYFGIFTLAFYSTMLERNYKLGDIYRGVILSFLAFPVYIRGTISGFFNRRLRFQITKKGKEEKLGFVSLLPYIAMIILYIMAAVFGIMKFSSNPYAVSINLFWVAYHLFILLHIFSLNLVPNFQSDWYLATKRT